jgi:predicted Zn-ribbon and HTH transcriptional regulator
MTTRIVEVADVIRAYGSEYRKTHKLPLRHLRALNDIASCRTAVLGGHVDRCDACGYERISYNSCRNRHCPKCGSLAKEKWLRARKKELLPVAYFHVVFTVPDDLNALILINQRVMYALLFQAAAETLLQLGGDKKHLGAELGLIAVLHTWGQNLMDHPHVHCIVPGGGLSQDGTRWIASRNNFFIPVRVLSRVFRGKFLEQLKKAYRVRRIQCVGKAEPLAHGQTFQKLLDRLYNKEWIVYAKQPFGGPEQVLAYLGRYTHRLAISNHRLAGMTDGKVSFRWRDYRDEDKEKIMTLEASEFLRRFLLHILPDGLCKIRYYGLLSNRKRKDRLDKCRRLLDAPKQEVESDTVTWQEVLLELTGIDVLMCPSCHRGKMFNERILQPQQHAPP